MLFRLWTNHLYWNGDLSVIWGTERKQKAVREDNRIFYGQVVRDSGFISVKSQGKYSRTSLARTLMARLLRLFRTRPCVPWKISHNPIAADLGFLGRFSI